VGHSFFNTLFDRLDVFARDNTTLNGVDELKASALLVLEQAQPDVPVLATTTRLADKLTLGLDTVLADSFAVGHLWLANIGFNRELTLHAVNNDLEVQLAHTRDDGLAG